MLLLLMCHEVTLYMYADCRHAWCAAFTTFTSPILLKSAYSTQHPVYSIQHPVYSIQHPVYSIQQTKLEFVSDGILGGSVVLKVEHTHGTEQYCIKYFFIKLSLQV